MIDSVEQEELVRGSALCMTEDARPDGVWMLFHVSFPVSKDCANAGLILVWMLRFCSSDSKYMEAWAADLFLKKSMADDGREAAGL